MTHYLHNGQLFEIDRMPPEKTLESIVDDIEAFSIYEPLWDAFHTYLSTLQPIPHSFTGHSRVVQEGEIVWRYETSAMGFWEGCSKEEYEATAHNYRQRIATPKITEGKNDTPVNQGIKPGKYITQKKKGNKINLYWNNGANIGCLYPESDGYYVFASIDNNGSWPGYALREIADAIDNLNKPWDDKINEYFTTTPINESTGYTSTSGEEVEPSNRNWWCHSCKREVKDKDVTEGITHKECGQPVQYLNAQIFGLTAQPDKQYPGRECGLSELEWQMEQVIDQIRSKETTIDCMAPLFKFLQSQNTAQSDKHGGSDIEFLHIIKELPLESRFRVCVQMAFINLITELGYREDKVWSPEEDEILSKLCSLAQKEAKHLSEEVHKWIKDGSPSPQTGSSVDKFEASIREFGINAALEYFKVPEEQWPFFRNSINYSGYFPPQTGEKEQTLTNKNENMKVNETAYDLYAAAALQGLISKAPFLDREGTEGHKKTQEEIDSIQEDMTNSAHHYAASMLRQRQKFLNWIEQSEESTTTNTAS